MQQENRNKTNKSSVILSIELICACSWQKEACTHAGHRLQATSPVLPATAVYFTRLDRHNNNNNHSFEFLLPLSLTNASSEAIEQVKRQANAQLRDHSSILTDEHRPD